MGFVQDVLSGGQQVISPVENFVGGALQGAANGPIGGAFSNLGSAVHNAITPPVQAVAPMGAMQPAQPQPQSQPQMGPPSGSAGLEALKASIPNPLETLQGFGAAIKAPFQAAAQTLPGSNTADMFTSPFVAHAAPPPANPTKPYDSPDKYDGEGNAYDLKLPKLHIQDHPSMPDLGDFYYSSLNPKTYYKTDANGENGQDVPNPNYTPNFNVGNYQQLYQQKWQDYANKVGQYVSQPNYLSNFNAIVNSPSYQKSLADTAKDDPDAARNVQQAINDYRNKVMTGTLTTQDMLFFKNAVPGPGLPYLP